MEQLFWLPPHADLSGATRAARPAAPSLAPLQAAPHLSAFPRYFSLTAILDRLLLPAIGPF